MTAKINALITRFKTELAADKKRAAVLGVLMLVLCVVVGRVVIGGGGSTPAAARATVATTVASAGPAIESGPGTVAPSVRPSVEVTPTIEPLAANPAVNPAPPLSSAPPEAITLKPVEIEPGPQAVTRDLFASSAWSSFPVARKSGSTQPATDEDAEPGFWGRFAAGLAERGVEHRGEMERIEKLAQELRIQATMSGSNPTAYISGRLVRVGDTIKSFSVVAIEDRSVTVALDGYHVVLRIP